jgi:hypothetical protein
VWCSWQRQEMALKHTVLPSWKHNHLLS